MRRTLTLTLLFVLGLFLSTPPIAQAYNYGDYRSVTLVSKAWDALKENDLDAVLAYTNKCFELYANQAKKMQESLTDYASGSKEEIFSYWALNDVATGCFIQGEAYRQAGMIDEAKAAYQKLIDEYTYGQCWNPEGDGFFWKPSEAAKEKLIMLETGSGIDFGDYKSATLAAKAWKALAEEEYDAVKTYVDKCLELYADKAQEMQASLTEYPWESQEQIFSYWALNDVGTSLFIQGEAYRKMDDLAKAKIAYQTLVDDYFYAQCWDPQGWFWKPAEAAQQKLDEMAE